MQDTRPEVADLQFELLRAASPERRLEMALRLTQEVRDMSRAALREAMPGASQRELDLAFVEIHYGRDLAERMRRYLESRT